MMNRHYINILSDIRDTFNELETKIFDDIIANTKVSKRTNEIEFIIKNDAYAENFMKTLVVNGYGFKITHFEDRNEKYILLEIERKE